MNMFVSPGEQSLGPCPGPVLVAVDLGPESAAAILAGAHLADSAGVGLRLLHVVHDPVDAPGFYRRWASPEGPLLPNMELARQRAEVLLADLRAAHGGVAALLVARWTLVAGVPGPRIVELATGLSAGVLVVAGRELPVGFSLHQRPSTLKFLRRHGEVPVVVACVEMAMMTAQLAVREREGPARVGWRRSAGAAAGTLPVR